MCERQTFSIDFIVRKCKADKTTADIFARVTVDGEIAEISTKDKIKHSNWDSGKEQVKGKSIEVAGINKHIEDVRFRIEEKYRELERNQKLITAQAVKDAYLGIQKKLKGRKLFELTQYFKKIWECKIGFKNYDTTIEYLERFVKRHFNTDDLYLSQITMQFATDFEHYVWHNPIKEHDVCKGNGLKKHIQRFKRILNWAAKEIHWIEANPCENYSCSVKKPKRKKLTILQVVDVESRIFSDEKLAYVRDLFIFSCYTGLAFADVMALCPADFERTNSGVMLCKVYRTKSEELCAVPFLKKAHQYHA